jgi:hypothetical protein
MIMMPYGRCRSSLQLTGTQTSGTPQAFFARYVLGDAAALATMTRLGNSAGIAALSSGGQLPPGPG